MKELCVTVSVLGGQSTEYRFDEPVVRIGRSAECHLSICHEAVPRELCRAWLEGDGTVRVEERPNLSNPLLCKGRRVVGGLSGDLLDLSVGPVQLKFSSSLVRPEKIPAGARKKKTVLAAGVAAVLLLASCIAVLVKPKPAARLSMPDLPDNPLSLEQSELCDSTLTCREKGKMLATRAKEIAHRAGAGAAEKVRAASLLVRAGRLLAAAGDPSAREVALNAKAMEQEVVAAYRRQVLALRLAVERGDRAAAISIAQNVAGYLADREDRAGERLNRLIGSKEEKR